MTEFEKEDFVKEDYWTVRGVQMALLLLSSRLKREGKEKDGETVMELHDALKLISEKIIQRVDLEKDLDD